MATNSKDFLDYAGLQTYDQKIKQKVDNDYAAKEHLHNAATTETNGFMSSTDKTKLDGIDNSANAWSSDTVVTNSSTGKTNTTSALTNGNVYLNHIENDTVRHSHKISGSGSTEVTSDSNGNIVISSTGGGASYTAGDGISIANDTISNSGVRSITTGTTKGSVAVNTNGTSADVIPGVRTSLELDGWIDFVENILGKVDYYGGGAFKYTTSDNVQEDDLVSPASEAITKKFFSNALGLGYGVDTAPIKVLNDTAAYDVLFANDLSTAQTVINRDTFKGHVYYILGTPIGAVINYMEALLWCGSGSYISSTTLVPASYMDINNFNFIPTFENNQTSNTCMKILDTNGNLLSGSEITSINSVWSQVSQYYGGFHITNSDTTISSEYERQYLRCVMPNRLFYIGTATIGDTHYTSGSVVTNSASGTSNTTSAISTNGNVYLNHVENGSVRNSHKISGSGATTVTADASGNIVVTSPSYVTYGTSDYTPGTTALTTGTIYCQYEA